jgi:hypothetical protein
VFSLDADSIVENFYDSGVIFEDCEFPRNRTKELQELLDKWCEEVKGEVDVCYEIYYETLIDVSEIIEEVKRKIEDETR